MPIDRGTALPEPEKTKNEEYTVTTLIAIISKKMECQFALAGKLEERLASVMSRSGQPDETKSSYSFSDDSCDMIQQLLAVSSQLNTLELRLGKILENLRI